jgi:imidazole glycerol-phosphate synthase subunit HisH
MSKETVALIDYGAGNVRSVFNALKFLGADVNLTADAAEIRRASRVVLPGVGAFGDCVRGLEARGLWQTAKDCLSGGQPFLGICVGYQMLFEESEESPDVRGLGFFPGKVKRFATPGLKVPQIGWNALDLTPHPLWKNLGEHPQVYFVHSYYCEPVDSSLVIGRTTYGETFAAAAAKGSVAGVQFHPEKSQDVGLGILRNFLQMEAR